MVGYVDACLFYGDIVGPFLHMSTIETVRDCLRFTVGFYPVNAVSSKKIEDR